VPALIVPPPLTDHVPPEAPPDCVNVTVPAPIHAFDVVTTGTGVKEAVTLPLTVAGQEGVVGYCTLTKLYVALLDTVMVAVPEPFSVIVWLGPPFILYVTIAFGVPVNVTVSELPTHTVPPPESVAVGVGSTVYVAPPVGEFPQSL
jgi:hypothetical protein